MSLRKTLQEHPSDRSRRDTLRTLGGLALLPSAARCATQEDPPPGACGVAPTIEETIEVPLEEYPALRTPGSAVEVRISEALLDIILIHTIEGCFVATWRICPHGACTVEYFGDTRELHCPCHGSRFSEDGKLLEGPAARALKSFAATQIGDSIFIQRNA